MAAKPWTRLESHQSTSAISSCCFEEVPNKQRAFSALSDFYVNTFGRALIDNIGKAFVSSPMRCTGWKVCSSHPPLPSLRLRRSFVFQPAAGLRQEELQIPVPWRNQTQRYGRDKLSSTPSAFLAGLAGVDKENHLNQTSQKERSEQHAVVKPELSLRGGRVST